MTVARRPHRLAGMGGAGLSAAGSAVLALGAGFASGQETLPASKPFVERVDVNVRSVLVVIRDPLGRRLPSPPGAADLEIRENGVAVEILGGDPALRETRPAASIPTAPQTSGHALAAMPRPAA